MHAFVCMCVCVDTFTVCSSESVRESVFAFMSMSVLTALSAPPLCVDHRPPHAASGLPAQRGVHPHAPHGRAPHWRADAVQSRRETLPRPLLRQQAQLVSAAYLREGLKVTQVSTRIDLSTCLIFILLWLHDITCPETINGSLPIMVFSLF